MILNLSAIVGMDDIRPKRGVFKKLGDRAAVESRELNKLLRADAALAFLYRDKGGAGHLHLIGDCLLRHTTRLARLLQAGA